METETQTTIDSIDIVTDDLIDVLAHIANGEDAMIDVLGGDSATAMATPEDELRDEFTLVASVDASVLVENGDVAEEVEFDDPVFADAVSINVV